MTLIFEHRGARGERRQGEIMKLFMGRGDFVQSEDLCRQHNVQYICGCGLGKWLHRHRGEKPSHVVEVGFDANAHEIKAYCAVIHNIIWCSCVSDAVRFVFWVAECRRCLVFLHISRHSDAFLYL